jgi:hypothetical protein
MRMHGNNSIIIIIKATVCMVKEGTSKEHSLTQGH